MKPNYEHKKAYIYKLENSIIKVQIKDNASLAERDIIEIKKINTALNCGKKYYLLFNAGNNTTISKEAHELSAEKEMSDNKKAQAVIINSLSQKILANFFINVQRPNILTKAFTDEEKAITWLTELSKKDFTDNE